MRKTTFCFILSRRIFVLLSFSRCSRRIQKKKKKHQKTHARQEARRRARRLGGRRDLGSRRRQCFFFVLCSSPVPRDVRVEAAGRRDGRREGREGRGSDFRGRGSEEEVDDDGGGLRKRDKFFFFSLSRSVFFSSFSSLICNF